MKTRRPYSAPSQSGNALWIILVAIALLAAATIAVTRSSDSTEESGSKEQDRIAASEIMRYAASIEQAVQQMQMRGLSENDISFENSTISGYENPNCVTGDCKIFDADGGGRRYTAPKSQWLDKSLSSRTYYGEWYITGAVCVEGVGTDNTPPESSCQSNGSTRDEDLVIIMPFVKKSICIAINNLANVSNPDSEPPQDAGDPYPDDSKYAGSYLEPSRLLDSRKDNDETFGKKTGCIEGDSSKAAFADGYYFYHVLIGR